MNEADARAALFVRAFESVPNASWSEADAAWASREARHALGARAPFEQFAARRAALATARLAQRDPKLVNVLGAAGAHGGFGAAAVAAAFVLGIASDAIGPGGRINILAPPMLAVLVWNLAVYLVLALRAFGAGRVDPVSGPVRRGFLLLVDRTRAWRRGAAGGAMPAWSRFVSDWTAAGAPLLGARIATLLHASAAALVVGALLSLYLRGIAFEFRAGWDSTFLDAAAVHRLLTFVLGPAASLAGIAMPGPDELARLRFALGGGENAARWIHLYALTLGLAIVLPRTVLATLAVLRTRALVRVFPLPLDDDYFERLRRIQSGEPVGALALPYGYRLREPLVQGLRGALERVVGDVALAVSEPLPQGAEDDVRAWLAPSADGATAAVPPAVVVAVFPMTATPERETHGAFVRALAAQKVPRLVAVVDESEFRRRFTGVDGERRLAERRGAWERVLHDEDVTPLFADLSAAAAASPDAGARRVPPVGAAKTSGASAGP